MTTRRRRLGQAAAWTISALVLLGTWFIVSDTPTQAEKRASFDVTVDPPDWGAGRNIRARVVGATFAEEIRDDLATARGNFFVVQIEASSVTEPAVLSVAELDVDGVIYTNTDRVLTTIDGASLLVGVPLTGVLAFELPADVRSGTADVRLGVSTDQRLDSLIVAPLELEEMTRVPAVTVFPTTFPTT